MVADDSLSCFSRGINSIVRILCNLAASFISITRTSSASVSSQTVPRDTGIKVPNEEEIKAVFSDLRISRN